MASTTTEYRGITQNEKTCWVLTDAAGEERHYPGDLAAAMKALEQDRTRGTLAPRDEPCWMAEALCGYVYDENGECAEHWPAPPDAFDRHLMSVEWRRGPKGELLCPAYSTCECDALAGVTA